MTPADLDELAALVAAMTPGPWYSRGFGTNDSYLRIAASGSGLWPGDPVCDVGHNVNNRDGDAAGIVALVNAAPELIRLARERDHAVAEWRTVVDVVRAAERLVDGAVTGGDPAALGVALDTAVQAMRAARSRP